MTYRQREILNKIGWWVGFIFMLLAGAWFCWLCYREPATWPDFPWEAWGALGEVKALRAC